MVLGCALALAGCGDDDGMIEVDAGMDAGELDSGELDAGELDAGPLPECDSTSAEVYETPSDLPAYDESEAGRVVRCAAPTSLTAARIQELATLRGYEGDDLTTSARSQLFSFRTPRANGVGALSSALLFVPDPMPTTPMPLVVLAHPTTGLGDECAPSRMMEEDASLQDTQRLLMPLIGSGHVVVMPDYIGLGTEGTVGFLNAREAGTTLLDAARAALALVPDGVLDGQVFLVGHSQLTAHAHHVRQRAAVHGGRLARRGVCLRADPWAHGARAHGVGARVDRGALGWRVGAELRRDDAAHVWGGDGRRHRRHGRWRSSKLSPHDSLEMSAEGLPFA